MPPENQGWSIKGIVFDNVNIVVDPHTNEDESSVLGNLFLNGGRGSVISNYGQNLYIGKLPIFHYDLGWILLSSSHSLIHIFCHLDGNVFLRDYDHRGTALFPKYNTTSWVNQERDFYIMSWLH